MENKEFLETFWGIFTEGSLFPNIVEDYSRLTIFVSKVTGALQGNEGNFTNEQKLIIERVFINAITSTKKDELPKN